MWLSDNNRLQAIVLRQGATMLKKAARRADALAKLLPDADPRKATTRADIARLGNECGCAVGGVFLIVASLLVGAYAMLVGAFGARLVVPAIVFVFVASMLGKLTGVLIAVARLNLIRRRLFGHVPAVGDPTPQTAPGGA
jgi:hypothetical protein